MTKEELEEEISHLQELGSLILPRKENLPRLKNIDYYGGIEPYKGCVGGDHMVILNFDEFKIDEKIKNTKDSGYLDQAKKLERYLDRIGILLVDVSGHMISDTLIANYIHASFKTGVAYELLHNQDVTTRLIEMMNTDIYNLTRPDYITTKPYATLMYGEMDNNGMFRYVLAGHPRPIVFSNEFNRIVELEDKYAKASTPLGVLPSKFNMNKTYNNILNLTKNDYEINEMVLLGPGDIMLLYTDGFVEQDNGNKNFSKSGLEEILKENKTKSTKEIYSAIINALNNYGPQTDDRTILVIKKI